MANDKYVINLGRQLGSGGREIGKKLAAELGINCYDKELLTLSAKESGLCQEFFEKADEKSTITQGKFYRAFNGSDNYPEKLFSKEGLFKLLEGHGYKVIDLTELNGITYFCTRVKKPAE